MKKIITIPSLFIFSFLLTIIKTSSDGCRMRITTGCVSCENGYYKYSGSCYPCNDNCKESSDNCECNSCNEGDILLNGQCISCDSNCLTCLLLPTKCTSCKEGFYLNSNNKCVGCINNCRTCSSENICTSCLDNYYLVENICIPCPFNCKTQINNCLCEDCNDGFYLSNNNCLNCDQNCLKCADSAYNCLSCNEGYYLNSDKSCVRCPELCKSCSSENICDLCQDHYFTFEGICYECNINCKTTENDNCKCESCGDGYYLLNHQCLECDNNCKTCSENKNNCISCNEGFYLTDTNTCEECIAPCKTCSNANICTSCIDYYFSLSDNCLECNVNCKETENDNCKCNDCEEGFYLLNHQCLECDNNCKTCSEIKTNCLSCREGCDLLPNGICVLCASPCKTCSSANICTSCIDNYFLLSDKCLKCNINCKTTEIDNCKCNNCEDGFYLYNNQCLECDNNCKTCSETEMNCLSCREGFYLTESNTCERCIEPCKTCLSENTCLSCVDNYFLISKNCYQCNINCKTSFDNCKCITCDTGYYFNNYQCLKCVDNCKTCTHSADYCTSCDTNKYLYENSCLNCNESCNINNNQTDQIDIIEKEEEIKFYDEVLKNVDKILTSEFYDTSYIDSGYEKIMEIGKIKVILTTAANQRNNENENVTLIELGECGTLLKEFYNIKDDKLYMKKIDIIQDKMQIPKVEFEVYSKLNSSNLEKLDISICKDSKIYMIIPIDINESLDKINPRSDYYNDICNIATSENGTDISLKERRKEFIEKNKAICQDDCDLNDYNYTTKKANCSCKPKERSLSFADMHINMTKLKDNFINVKNVANLNILICYKKLLTIEGIVYNIGSYIVIAIIILHIISIIIFYAKQKNLLKQKINDIVFAINNLALVNNINNVKNGSNKKNNRIKFKGQNQKNNTSSKRNILNKKENFRNEKHNIGSIQLNDGIKKMKINQLIKTNNPIRKNNLNHNFRKGNNFFNNPLSNLINKNNNKINNRNNKGKVQLPLKNNYLSQNLSKRQKRTNNYNPNNLNSRVNNKNLNTIQKKKERVRKIFEYTDEEKNLLEYNSAKKYDKRKYCGYYKSLLKTKHIFIFSFFQTNDYNARIVKIDLFFVSFAIYYTVSGLFFDDKTMHKIYVSSGSFNLEYQISKIVYSFLISVVINKIFSLLALTDGAIIKLKEDKNKEDSDERKKNLENNIKIKLVFYFIISFLFLLYFWYYIAMFGTIYKNTQLHLLKDTIISFGLSMLYPFIIYLFPGFFRIPALSNGKKYRKSMYNFSKFLQLF